MTACLSPVPRDGFIALPDQGYWIAPHALRDEADFARCVTDIRNRPCALEFPQEWLEQQRESFIQQFKTHMDECKLEQQLNAIFSAFERSTYLSVITGPPGAAKSTITGSWMRIAHMRYPDMPIILMTQEETALQRLQGKFNLPQISAWVVDDALQQENWPQNAVVVIDEAGIFSTEMLTKLLRRALDSNAAKIILIGDDKQLVSDAPGQPFRWLCEQEDIDKIELPQSFRQKNLWLRQAVQSLYKEDIAEAVRLIPTHFVAHATILDAMADTINEAESDNTLILSHGLDNAKEMIHDIYPDFRVLSLAEAQGLAIDRVILLICQKINMAELLVGCSRQRFDLDLFIDQDVYKDATDFAQRVDPYPTYLMALDLMSPQELLRIADRQSDL